MTAPEAASGFPGAGASSLLQQVRRAANTMDKNTALLKRFMPGRPNSIYTGFSPLSE
jgi:hypothetical protein